MSAAALWELRRLAQDWPGRETECVHAESDMHAVLVATWDLPTLYALRSQGYRFTARQTVPFFGAHPYARGLSRGAS